MAAAASALNGAEARPAVHREVLERLVAAPHRNSPH